MLSNKERRELDVVRRTPRNTTQSPANFVLTRHLPSNLSLPAVCFFLSRLLFPHAHAQTPRTHARASSRRKLRRHDAEMGHRWSYTVGHKTGRETVTRPFHAGNATRLVERTARLAVPTTTDYSSRREHAIRLNAIELTTLLRPPLVSIIIVGRALT